MLISKLPFNHSLREQVTVASLIGRGHSLAGYGSITCTDACNAIGLLHSTSSFTNQIALIEGINVGY